MSCTTCLRGRLSPLTARLLSRAPGQSVAWRSFPKTKLKLATWASLPTLSPRRREGRGTQREGWGTQVPVLPANPHRINPFRLARLNGIFYDKRLVLNILRAHGGRGVPARSVRFSPLRRQRAGNRRHRGRHQGVAIGEALRIKRRMKDNRQSSGMQNKSVLRPALVGAEQGHGNN